MTTIGKILTIEDDSFLLGLESSKLGKYGYEVLSAKTGEEGMQKITEPGIDLVLLDLMLPNFDGFEILKKVRETESIKHLPVIVFSNLAEQKDMDKAKTLGANDFIVKSNFTLDELVLQLNKLLNK